MWPSPQGSGGPTGNPGDGFAVVLLGADEGEAAVDLEGLAAFVSAVGLDEGVWPAHGPQRRKKCREGAEAELQRARRQPDTADSRPATRKPPAMPALNRKAALLMASIGRMSRPRNGGPGHPPTPCGLGQVRENWAVTTARSSSSTACSRRDVAVAVPARLHASSPIGRTTPVSVASFSRLTLATPLVREQPPERASSTSAASDAPSRTTSLNCLCGLGRPRQPLPPRLLIPHDGCRAHRTTGTTRPSWSTARRVSGGRGPPWKTTRRGPARGQGHVHQGRRLPTWRRSQ